MPVAGDDERGRLALLDSLFADAPIGLAIVDADQRYRYVNAHLAEMNGVPAADHLGRTVEEIVPEAPSLLAGVVQQVLATGESLSGLAAEAVIDGRQRSWLASFHPLRTDSGAVVGVGVVVTEVTDQARTEADLVASETRLRLAIEAGRLGTWDWDLQSGEMRWSDEMTRMYGTTAEAFGGDWDSFAALVHPEDITAIEARVTRAIADGGSYEAEMRVRADDGWAGRVLARGQVFLDAAGTAVRMIGTAIDVTQQRDDADRVVRILEGQPDAFLAVDRGWLVTHVNAGAERLLRRQRGLLLGRGLWDALPELRGTVFGTEYRRAVDEQVTVAFEAVHPGTSVWVEARAHPTADGLNIFLRDIDERRQAEHERNRLERQREVAIDRTVRLATVASALTESLDEGEVGRLVINQAIAAVGARGGWVAVLDDMGMRWVAVEGYEPALRATLVASPLEIERPVTRVTATREPIYVSEPATMARLFPEFAPTFAATGDRSLASLPLVAGGRVLGGITLTFPKERTFDLEERSFLAALADTGAQALERARLYQREHAVAETLQRALLPEHLADPPGLSVAARYKPGTEGIEVGGDWYDVFDLGENRIGIALGDVVGKGVAAAAVMGRLRNVLRAFATAFDSPATVLAKVDEFLARFTSEDLATVVYGVLDASTGELRFCSAGHLPMFVAGVGGAAYLAQEPGVPVGVTNAEPRPEQRHRLTRGDTLVLFTDGLVEDRRRSIDDGLDDLARAAVAVLGEDDCDVDRVCDQLLHDLVGPSGGADDVALLVLRWDGPDDEDQIDVVLPAEVASARRARALVAEQLARWGELALVEAAMLCTSEVVTNAVVHTGTPVRLTVCRLEDRVRIEVRDGGAAPPERLSPDLEAIHGRGVAIVEMTAAAWGVEPTDDGKVVWFELTTPG